MARLWRTWAETGRPAPELRNNGGRKRFEVTFLWGEQRSGGVDGVNGGVGGVSEPVFNSGEPVNGPVEPVNDPVGPTGEPENLCAGAPLPECILSLLIAEPGLRVPEMVVRLGSSRNSVKRALKALKAAGRVTFRGTPKTGGYYPSVSDGEDADS